MSRWSEARLRRVALAAVMLSAALLVVSVALGPESRGLPALVHPDSSPIKVDFLITGSALSIVGVLLAWLRPRNPIGWLLTISGLLGAVCNAGQAYGALAIAAPERHLPFGYFVLAASAPLWTVPLIVPGTLVLSRFPSGQVSGRWARRFDGAALVGVMLVCIGYACSPNAITDEIRMSTVPHLMPKAAAAALFAGGGVVLVAGFVGTVVTTVRRMLRAAAPERQQILLLLVAVVLAITGVLTLSYDWMGALSFALVPAAIALGVLRYRLLGIDVVVRRTLLYATLTGLVLAVFVAVTAGLAEVLPRGPAPVVVAASLIAVGLAPVRERVQQIVDRVVYGDRDDPWSALARLSSPLGDGADHDVLQATAEALAAALHVPSVRIIGPAGESLAVFGAAPAEHEFPLLFGGAQRATLALGARRGESHLADADSRLVAAVAPLVAVVVHAVALTDELRIAQDRLRSAAETERHRLRQDLHDGLGPSLTGVGLGLEALQSATGQSELVDRLRAEVGNALREVRRIIDDLRPGAIDDHGLVEALRERVTDLRRHSTMRFVLDTPNQLDVPAEVEVATYRIVDEALTNVVKHAHATCCSIRITVDDRLRLVVDDDGIGPRTHNGHARSGVGLPSMRARAERLGGCFAVSDRRPGTRISVDLPLEHA
jgi:signal transduction histidine kinase